MRKRNFALKGLLLLAAIALCTGFFACKVATGGGEEAPLVTLTFDAGEGSFGERFDFQAKILLQGGR